VREERTVERSGRNDERRLPDFLIVGVQKGGTSSLAASLGNHPDVYVLGGEGHFFDRDFIWEQGLDAYAAMFRGHRGQAVMGENTPMYASHPEVPARIASSLPEVRLIWLFRNPVDRAYSHYWLAVAKGRERETFARRMAATMAGDCTSPYLVRGRYAEEVERYLERFDRSQVLFLLSDRFQSEPRSVLKDTCRFLGVTTDVDFDEVYLERNSTRIPKSLRLQAWGSWVCFRDGQLRRERLWKAINRLNLRPGYPPMDPATRRTLEEYFAPLNGRLADLIGLDVSAWAGSADQVDVPRSSSP
jgi:hypothetical protein